MKRKAIIALILMFLLSGCSGTQIDADSTTEQTTEIEQTEEDTSSDESTKDSHVENLVIGTTKQIEGLSILDQSGSFGRLNYNSVVYANMFYEDSNNEVQGYFFDSYEITADGYELVLTFPTDKIWHDGEAVTAEDVQFTFEYLRDVYGSSALQTLTEARIDSESQVTLIFSEAKAYYYVKSSSLTSMILPKHIWEDVDDPDNYAEEDAAIGCGPYKLVEVDEEAGTLYYEVVPENNYLGELTVDSITLKSYSSQDALLMALANGEIDVIYEYANPISYSLLDVIADNEDVDSGASDYTGNNQATFNMTSEANSEVEFREAVLKSLNWELITQLSNGDYGQIPGAGILPTACAGYDSSIWTLYQDVDEAAALLDSAGYVDADGDGWRDLPDGSAFTYKICIQYSSSRLELFSRFAEVIVDSLQEVGINAYFDTDSISSEEVNDQMCEEGDYDIFLGYTTSGVARFRTCFWYFVPRSAVGNSGAMAWGNTNENQDVIDAYDQLQTATSDDEYLDAVSQLQTLASEQLFAFALCWEQCFFPYRTDKYEGFENISSIGVVHCETFYQLTEK